MDHEQPAEIDPPKDHSPFHRLIGWTIESWVGGRAVLTCEVKPDFMNRNGNLHGGLIATLIDAAAGYAAAGDPPGTTAGPATRGVTLSLTINYLGAARDGLLTVTATRTGGGKSIAFVKIEVAGPDGAPVAEGVCTYRRFPPKG
jgi:uncharacterized protein (TIGR00369 family)